MINIQHKKRQLQWRWRPSISTHRRKCPGVLDLKSEPITSAEQLLKGIGAKCLYWQIVMERRGNSRLDVLTSFEAHDHRNAPSCWSRWLGKVKYRSVSLLRVQAPTQAHPGLNLAGWIRISRSTNVWKPKQNTSKWTRHVMFSPLGNYRCKHMLLNNPEYMIVKPFPQSSLLGLEDSPVMVIISVIRREALKHTWLDDLPEDSTGNIASDYT